MDAKGNRPVIYEMYVTREKKGANTAESKANEIEPSLETQLPSSATMTINDGYTENSDSSESKSVKKLSEIFDKRFTKEPKTVEKISSKVPENKSKTEKLEKKEKIKKKEQLPNASSPLWHFIRTFENIKDDNMDTNKSQNENILEENEKATEEMNKKDKNEEKHLLKTQHRTIINPHEQKNSNAKCPQKWLEIEVVISYRDEKENPENDKKPVSEIPKLVKSYKIRDENDFPSKDQTKDEVNSNEDADKSKISEKSTLVKSIISNFQKTIERNKNSEKKRHSQVKPGKLACLKLKPHSRSAQNVDQAIEHDNEDTQNISKTVKTKIKPEEKGIAVDEMSTDNKAFSLVVGEPDHKGIKNGPKKKNKWFKSSSSQKDLKIEPFIEKETTGVLEAEINKEKPKLATLTNFKISSLEREQEAYAYADQETKLNFKKELEKKLFGTPNSHDPSQKKNSSEFLLNSEEATNGISFQHELKNYSMNEDSSEEINKLSSRSDVFSYKIGQKSKEEEMTGWEKVETVTFVNKRRINQEKEVQEQTYLEDEQPQDRKMPSSKLFDDISGTKENNILQNDDPNQYKAIESFISKHVEKTSKLNGEINPNEAFSELPSAIDFDKKIKNGATRLRKTHRPDIPKNFIESPSSQNQQSIILPIPDYD